MVLCECGSYDLQFVNCVTISNILSIPIRVGVGVGSLESCWTPNSDSDSDNFSSPDWLWLQTPIFPVPMELKRASDWVGATKFSPSSN